MNPKQLLRPARDLFWKLPYPAMTAAYYAAVLPPHARRFVAGCHEASLAAPGSVDLAARRTSDTVFILGSGWSLNQISDARWRAIAHHDSFGFNFSLALPHVPTVYTTEAADPTDFGGQRRVAADRLRSVWDARADDYRGVPILISDMMAGQRAQWFRDMPDAFRAQSVAIGTVPAVARNEEEFAWSARWLARAGLFEPSPRPRAVLKYRGTLSMMISLAVRMSYRNIVLCGIDMNDPRYFYDDVERYPLMADYGYLRAAGPQHVTVEERPREARLDEVVYALDRWILKPRGVALYVENPSSGLHPRIPAAPASLFDLAGASA